MSKYLLILVLGLGLSGCGKSEPVDRPETMDRSVQTEDVSQGEDTARTEKARQLVEEKKITEQAKQADAIKAKQAKQAKLKEAAKKAKQLKESSKKWDIAGVNLEMDLDEVREALEVSGYEPHAYMATQMKSTFEEALAKEKANIRAHKDPKSAVGTVLWVKSDGKEIVRVNFMHMPKTSYVGTVEYINDMDGIDFEDLFPLVKAKYGEPLVLNEGRDASWYDMPLLDDGGAAPEARRILLKRNGDAQNLILARALPELDVESVLKAAIKADAKKKDFTF